MNGTNDMNENYEEIAQVFVEQYNLNKGTHYEFECLRKSMFSIPKYEHPSLEIYEMAFIEGKKRSPIVADLMVMTRLQKRLIIEIVKPHLSQETTKDTPTALSRLVEDIGHIVDPIERDALGEVVCSKYLLIDGRGFGRIRIDDLEIYKKSRLERDKLFERFQNRKIYGAKEIKQTFHELSQLGIPTKHWFKEIWFLYQDEKGLVRCLQIW